METEVAAGRSFGSATGDVNGEVENAGEEEDFALLPMLF